MNRFSTLCMLLAILVIGSGCSLNHGHGEEEERRIFEQRLTEAIAEYPTQEEVAEFEDLPQEAVGFFDGRRDFLREASSSGTWTVDRFSDLERELACEEVALEPLNAVLFREISCFGACRRDRFACSSDCVEKDLTTAGEIICNAGCQVQATACRGRCVFRTFGEVGIGITLSPN